MSLIQNDEFYYQQFEMECSCIDCDEPSYLCTKCSHCETKNEGHEQALLMNDEYDPTMEVDIP